MRPPTPTRWTGGRVREIARRGPKNSFTWRISTATIERTAHFTPMRGVCRTLTVLSSELDLVVGGRRHRLAPGDTVAFDGARTVLARPRRRGVVVLNLMTRGRTRLGSAAMEREIARAG